MLGNPTASGNLVLKLLSRFAVMAHDRKVIIGFLQLFALWWNGNAFQFHPFASHFCSHLCRPVFL